MRSTAIMILGLVGLVAVGAGLVLASASGGWTTIATILAIAGAALILVFVAGNWAGVKGVAGSRSTAYGANLALVALLLIAILAIINVLGSRHHKRFDLTHSGMFSLAGQTVSLLQGLDKDVKALAFFRENSGEKNAVEDLLNEYSFVSNKFDVQFIDPDKSPGITKTYGVTEYGTVILESGDKVERITQGGQTAEEHVTNALLKVVREGRKKIYFVEGHGEADIADAGRTGYSGAKTSLETQNYEVEKLFLMREEEIPDDCSLLVLAGPEKELLETEMAAIERYVDRAGKVLFMLDPNPSAGMLGFFEQWEVRVGEDVVVDVSPAGRLFGVDEFMPMAMSYPAHPITEGFNVATLFPYARSVSVGEQKAGGISAQTFVETGAQSWAETGPVTGEIAFDPDTDIRGPVSLAVAITVDVTDAVADTAAPMEGEGDSEPAMARLVVIGDSEFANNSFLKFSGDEDFFLNVVSWLAEEEDLISIRPKDPEDRRVNLTAKQTRIVMYLTLLVLPLCVLGLGVGVWVKRR
jgi:ABC-type uncharacterized transport system involved in gliding motility auxiliary subunit